MSKTIMLIDSSERDIVIEGFPPWSLRGHFPGRII